ncbi:hypothetical protein [Megamonas hypermegale]|uniref:hypothetical protein n=1 Tax=Megamonas hypermegale TaxID=158847 RepID=UPI003207FBF7
MKPPLLDKDDERNPVWQKAYKNVDKNKLPLAESLKDTIARVVPTLDRVFGKYKTAARQ